MVALVIAAQSYQLANSSYEAQHATDIQTLSAADAQYADLSQQLIDCGQIPGMTSGDHAELVAARKRIAELESGGMGVSFLGLGRWRSPHSRTTTGGWHPGGSSDTASR